MTIILTRIVDVCILTSNKEKYWVFNEALDEGWSISLPKKISHFTFILCKWLIWIMHEKSAFLIMNQNTNEHT